MKSAKNLSFVILLVIGILVLINILATKFFFRLDFTEDKRYTLSQATKDILDDLQEPVTITAYFSGNLPVQLDRVERDFRDLLVEYSNASHGMVVYEFFDPLKEDNGEAEAQQAGIMQMQVQVREENQMKAQIAYMGAVIQLGEQKEIIPVIQSTNGMEYNLTSSIKKLAVTEKPLVGFLRGHGEPSIRMMQQAMYDLEVLYKVEEVFLTDSTRALDKFNSLAIIAPTDSFPDYALQQLDEFINRGGNLLVAINRADADLNTQQFSTSVNTGLESWLSQKGVIVNNNLVIDANSVSVLASVQGGQAMFRMPISIPQIPIINNFADHPVSGGLEQVILQFVSSVDFRGDSAVTYTPLLNTSENSGTRPADGYLEIGKQWSEADFPVSSLTVAAALEGKIGNGPPTKLIVIGDGDFAVNKGMNQGQGGINPDNISLLVNSIDWLSDATGLIELRTQGITARPLDELEKSKQQFLKYLNFLLPILLAIGYGIFRYQRNRIIRLKRTQKDYV